jgi:hypothetical protein
VKRCLSQVCFAVVIVSGAIAQARRAVPPPPKPSDDGPSLEVTMKFIQDKLSSVGPTDYMIYRHDEIAQSDSQNKFHFELSNVVADPTACTLSNTTSVKKDDGKPNPVSHSIALKGVADIVVLPLEQQYKKSSATEGHPELSYRADPPIFAVVVHLSDPADHIWNYFNFYDEALADRVAKALLHAVELCGGGSKPEPF